MDKEQKKFELYSIVLRYLKYKVTHNLKKIYLDVDFESKRMILTTIFLQQPTAIDLDLLDDIVINSNAPIPDFHVEADVKLAQDYDDNQVHDFLIFAFFDESRYDFDI